MEKYYNKELLDKCNDGNKNLNRKKIIKNIDFRLGGKQWLP